jgi:O-acetyl-ADP-ribose deacetylase (regulator of RNase III)
MADQTTYCEGRVIVLLGDITKQEVGAIVNAANASLLGGGGVDGAGGPAIVEECRMIRRTKYPHGLPTGEAVITTGGTLPARHVIHTVGPIYGRHHGDEAELLASCYKNSLMIAATNQLNSIAFPAISTGAYGYPRPEAAAVASTAIAEFLLDNPFPEVRLVFVQASDLKAFVTHQKFSRL